VHKDPRRIPPGRGILAAIEGPPFAASRKTLGRDGGPFRATYCSHLMNFFTHPTFSRLEGIEWVASVDVS